MLDPEKLIPAGFDRFALAGDPTWDLLPGGTELACPDLFARSGTVGGSEGFPWLSRNTRARASA